MSHDFTDIESIIQCSIHGRLDRDAFYSFCAAHGLKPGEVCNEIALTVARRFNDSAMTFEDADAVMNAISTIILGYGQDEVVTLPEPAWSIYLAFDAGEYDHGEGADPIERFTKPLLREVLARQ